jgi:hypothetical protein
MARLSFHRQKTTPILSNFGWKEGLKSGILRLFHTSPFQGEGRERVRTLNRRESSDKAEWMTTRKEPP